MEAIGTAITLGTGLGLSAGVSPGPLLTLVVSSSLRGGFGAGARVAVAPLLTDLPIVAAVLLFVSNLPGSVVTGMSVAGGSYVVILGLRTTAEGMRAGAAGEAAGGSGQDLQRGVLVNVLNPQAWIFWLGVGGPLLVRYWSVSWAAPLAFALSFWASIVGCKLAIAWGVARGRRLIGGRGYRYVVASSGLVLMGMGVWIVVGALGG